MAPGLGAEPFRPNPADVVLRDAIGTGVCCEVFRESLWLADMPGMLAIIAEDNLNAGVQMGVGEMEVVSWFSHRIVEKQSGAKQKLTSAMIHEQLVVEAMRQFGQQAYSPSDYTCMFNIAARLGSRYSKMLAEMHFAMLSPALSSVRPKDLNTIADLSDKYHFVKIAVLIHMYLGSSDVPQTREAGGRSQVAKPPNPAAIKSLIADPERMPMADRFLKTVATTYKYSEGVVVKKLIVARGGLFYRVGRMVVSWPPTEFHQQKMFADIENKFRCDLQAAGMKIDQPMQYQQPTVIRTVEPKAKAAKRAAVAADVAGETSSAGKVAKTEKAGPKLPKGAIAVMEMHTPTDAGGAVKNASEQVPATDNGEDKGDDEGQDKGEDKGDGEDNAAEAGSAAGSAFGVQLPHTLPAKMFAAQTHRSWNSFSDEITRATATGAILHSYLAHPNGVDNTVVANMQQPDCIVWQVRAKKAFAVGELVLVPYSKVPVTSMVAECKDPKRPPAVHPKVAAWVKVGVTNESIADAKTVLVASPVGKKSGDTPAAFWCVVGVGHAKDANVEIKTVDAEVPINSIAAHVRAVAKTKGKAKAKSTEPTTRVTCQIPVFVNKKQVAKDTVLTVVMDADGVIGNE